MCSQQERTYYFLLQHSAILKPVNSKHVSLSASCWQEGSMQGIQRAGMEQCAEGMSGSVT